MTDKQSDNPRSSRRHSRDRRKLVYPCDFKPADFVRFVQWDGFVRDWADLGLNDDDLRALEVLIMAHPKSAPVVAATGGLRKIRFAPSRWRSGKSGAARIGYVYFEQYATVLLLVTYSKDEQDDLSAKEKKIIRSLIDEIQECFDNGLIR